MLDRFRPFRRANRSKWQVFSPWVESSARGFSVSELHVSPGQKKPTWGRGKNQSLWEIFFSCGMRQCSQPPQNTLRLIKNNWHYPVPDKKTTKVGNPRETIGVKLSQNIDNEIVTQINLAASLILIQYSIKNARIINHIYKDIYQTKQPSSQLRIRIFLYVIDKTQFFYKL